MQFMQLQPMQKNNQQDQMMKLLQATLARGGNVQPSAPQPAQGATMPGGAMNLVPPAGGGFMSMMPGQGMGLLSGILKKMQPDQPGAPIAGADPAVTVNSGNAIY